MLGIKVLHRLDLSVLATNIFSPTKFIEIALASTKHRVRSAYEASPASDFQCFCSSGMYCEGWKESGDSSSGIELVVVSSAFPAD